MTPRKPDDHGTSNNYAYGCRCELCTKAAVREDALRRLDRLAGRPRSLSVDHVVGRVRELIDRPLSYWQVGEMTGVDWQTIRGIHLGLRKTVRRATAERILAVPADAPTITAKVPALGAARRLQALYAMGHLVHEVAAECGMSRDMVWGVSSGRWVTMDRKRFDAVCRAYEKLSMISGESWKARHVAQKNGWAPPLAWDEGALDDPDARPILGLVDEAAEEIDEVAVKAYIAGRMVTVTDRERLEAVARGTAAGMSYAEFDRLHGLSESGTRRFVDEARKIAEEQGLPFPEIKVERAKRAFSDEEVIDIRRRAEAGETDLQIALAYGAKRQTVQRVVTGVSYAEVGGPIRAKRRQGAAAGSREFGASPLPKAA